MDNAGANTSTDVMKCVANAGGDIVLRHILPHTPQLNPIEKQWSAIKGGVGGTYFRDFGSMQTCINTSKPSKPPNRRQ